MCKIFVQVAAQRGHRRKLGKHARVLLSGATVDVATKAMIDRLAPRAGSVGLLHDQTYAHAKRTGFTPAKHLPSGQKARSGRGVSNR